MKLIETTITEGDKLTVEMVIADNLDLEEANEFVHVRFVPD